MTQVICAHAGPACQSLPDSGLACHHATPHEPVPEWCEFADCCVAEEAGPCVEVGEESHESIL